MSRKKKAVGQLQHVAAVRHTYYERGLKLQTNINQISIARLTDEYAIMGRGCSLYLDKSQIDTVIGLLTAWKETIEDNQ